MMKYIVTYAESAVKDGIFRELVQRQTDEEYELEATLTEDRYKRDF